MQISQRAFAILVFSLGLATGVIMESHIFTQASNNSPTLQANAATPDLDKKSDVVALKPAVSLPEVKLPALDKSIGNGAPKLMVDQPIYNFGEEERGNIVKHTFLLRNKGNAPLTIAKTKAACGCTVPQLSSNVIPPGGEASLEVTLNLKLQEGPQDRAIMVQSDDPTQPNLKLSLVGTATSRVVRNPKFVGFGAIKNDEPLTQAIDIQAKDELTFNVTGTRTSGDEITAEIETIEPGKQYRVKVKMTPPAADGQFRGWVHVETDHPGEYRIIGIPVTATKGDVAAAPSAAPGPLARLMGQQLEISGPGLNGGSVDIAEGPDKPVIVIFWASWCGYCKKEIPNLVQLQEEYGKEGLKVVGVNVDADQAKAKEACETFGISWENIHFPSDGSKSFKNPLSARYGISGIPAVLLLDKEGKVIAIERGEKLKERVHEICTKTEVVS